VAWIGGFRRPTGSQLRYLTAMLSSVRSRTGYHGPIVLDVAPGNNVNAFALGTGHMAVTTGWFRLPWPEQQAVLAHEVGHLAGRHSLMSGSLSIMSTAGNWLGWLAIRVGLGFLVGAMLSYRRRSEAQGLGLEIFPLAFALFAVLMSLVIWTIWASYNRPSEYEAAPLPTGTATA